MDPPLLLFLSCSFGVPSSSAPSPLASLAVSLREGWHRSARPLSSPSPRVASGQQQHSIGRSRSFFLLQHSSWFNTKNDEIESLLMDSDGEQRHHEI